ncbi:ethylene-insensitive protein 2-like isoform X2 [Macadamia integrifolia]|uniref:ethylene-insensitive protein 2-like isoform X2 n=1 Tax=Macadamia integrifolia TaxID=60698 RepID=UPI001C527EE5|nr:ethylene-insensitive protein 2-like isoform X2 [Macadamia integrifolia]
MEASIVSINQMLGFLLRRLPAVGPVLLLSMGYIDPGKWAAAVEGGARFGFDLLFLMLVFNFAAILCQYLSARIGVVTGKNLAQIYSEEFNKSTCILLGVQAELSVIASDLTMILGIAHGLNLLFGMDLLTCVLFAAIDAILFPLFTTLWQKCSEVLSITITGFVLLSYILGVVMSQPDIPVATSGVLTRLSGESVFSVMSLLGATIVPHNFYVHSSIVQLQVQPHAAKDAICHDHFVAILCMFSGIFVVNCVLMNAAATVFHNAGLVILTFQDAFLLMEQVFRSPAAPLVFFLVVFFSSQITALTWKFGGQVVLHYFFGVDLPDWLHRAVIRILAVVPALFCAWNYGEEGIYQMLIFTQVMLALLLPSSIVPLLRVASSRSIMAVFRVSQFVEFLTLVILTGMLGLKVIFVLEILFGNSDWVGDLRSNMGSTAVLSYVLITACVSFCMMLWFAAIPLKSATVRQDSQLWNSDLQTPPLSSVEREESDLLEARYQEPAKDDPALEKFSGCPSEGSVMEFDIDLPEKIMDSDQEPHLISVESCNTTTTSTTISTSSTAVLGSLTSHPEESAFAIESAPHAVVVAEACDDRLQDSGPSQKSEYTDPVEKTAVVGGDIQTEKDDGEGDTWDLEESSKMVSGSALTTNSEGPRSFRSLSGKSDEGGNGSASLSRLSGLGRAARRQLAAILDEFWGQLYDFHGQATQEAKAKKLNTLLGADSRSTASSPKIDPLGNESSGYFSDRGSGFLVNSCMCDSPKQQRMENNAASTYGVQMGPSSLWSTSHMKLLDAYVQSSINNVQDYGERRCSSLHMPPSSDGWDYQPATVRGYQIASYLGRLTSGRDSDSLTTVMDPPTPKSTSFVPTNYRDSIAYALGQKPLNGSSSINVSAMQNPAVSRNFSLQTERPYYDPCSSGAVENTGTSAYNKKYYSLPDISGLAVPSGDSSSSERSAQWGSPIGFGQLAGRKTYDQSLYSNTGPRAEGVPLAFDEISPSKLYRDPFSVQLSSNSDTRSLWSRQPFEQLFGVAGKPQCVGDEGAGSKSNSVPPEASSHIDLEAKLLRSFRYCIVKLLKLEGSDWLFDLFRQNDGADEDLILLVAARERFHYEAESREVRRVVQMGESRYPSSDRKLSSALKNEEAGLSRLLVSSVPHCGEGCVWRMDLIVSFGVWCIHRILDLSLLESRPELWGKYTYVLNRLQGILDLAFSKPRSALPPCFCLQVPALHLRKSSPPQSNGFLPPSGKPIKGKCTNASMLLDIVKDVEIAVSCRKGRTGTAAGDVAFPKGKENLASVLKRYKRRLSNKQVGTHEVGPELRKVHIPTSYAL